MDLTSNVELLRLYLDDRDTGDRTLIFEDPELAQLLGLFDDDVHAAAAQGWAVKAGRVSQWYQVNLDGAFLSREQVFQHCMDMVKFHEGHSTGSATIENIELTGPTEATDDEESDF